jgi:hypothetical protein
VLSVHDVERREVLFVGDDGGELVVRPRFRAADARFDQPDLRLVSERRREGDSLTIVVARDGDGFLLGMGPKHRTVYNTASRGWGLLYYVESAPTKARTALGLLWIAALCVPAGFWARSRRAAVLASLGVIATLALIPMVTALGTTPPAEYVAAVAGVLIGRALAQVATRLRLGGESPGQPVASRVYRRA